MTDKGRVELLRTLGEYAADVRIMETDLAESKIRRNKAITAAIEAGIPAATVARFAGLTPGRVSQMVVEGKEDDDE